MPAVLHSSVSFETIIDFGIQPLTNRFLRDATASEELYPLALGVESLTGLVRVVNPAPIEAVRSRFDWIKYNEAEDHLNDLVERIAKLAGVSHQSRILALSYKDDSMIERFRKKDFANSTRLDLQNDLYLSAANTGLETIQNALSPQWAVQHVARHGRSDVVIARHIWEHCHRPGAFAEALKILTTAGGYIVLEVPDCSTLLESCDYSMPWEEHVLYFTPATFSSALAWAKLDSVEQLTYPYPLENSLVCIARNQATDVPDLSMSTSVEAEVTRAHRYGATFHAQRHALQSWLSGYRQNRGPIAVLGAGHSACMFINLHQLAPLLSFVADDAAVKQGLLMPGSRLPIRTSAQLLDDKISLCILSVNHNAEEKVVARNDVFVKGGGEFRSLYRTSPRRLPS